MKRVEKVQERVAERKTSFLRVRLTPQHRGEIEQAARRKGLSVSAWVTERVLECARREA